MSQDGLRLVIENLGPIGHASVSVRPLTVLIGRNNTGKTYLAQALYASFRAIEELRPRVTEPLTTDERKQLEGISQQKQPGIQGTVPLRIGDLPSGVQMKVTEWVRHALHDAGSALNGRMLAYFSEPDLDNISRWGQPQPVSVAIEDDSGEFCYFGTSNPKEPDLSSISAMEIDWDEPMTRRHMRLAQRRKQDVDDELINHEYSTQLSSGVWYRYLQSSGFSGTAHYLPAGRSGLLHAWTDVVKLRLELERERFGLPGMPDTSLDGVALDFILSLAGILGRRHRRLRRQYSLPLTFAGFWTDSEKSDDAESMKLLRELMQGEIDAGSDEDMGPNPRL